MLKFIFKQSILLFILGIVTFSCNKEEGINDSSKREPIEQSKHFVSNKEASDIVSSIKFSTQENLSLRAKGVANSEKEVEDITPVPDDNGNTSYYIINYKGGGFLILAADRRVDPVLAFSESNEFPVDPKEYPSGLVEWLANKKDLIKYVRYSINDQSEEIARAWQLSEIQQILNPIKTKNISKKAYPYNSYKVLGPLLKTEWGQLDGYNNLLPTMGCSGNGRPSTGCVATAMAQVMRYYEYPKNYNWGAMNNHKGSYETQRLMRDIGKAVNMKYVCGSSGANKKKAASSFFKYFGYHSASYTDHYPQTDYIAVMAELNMDRVVILINDHNRFGHAWVCDGIKGKNMSSYHKILYYHMNWGWNGDYNAWYEYLNWSPGDRSYNHKKGMINNIIPYVR